MEPLSQEHIVLRRREIEQELTRMLRETGSRFTLDHIKDALYRAESQRAIAEIIKMFNTDREAVALTDIVATIMDAWNYFPHRILGGLSPAERALQFRRAADNQN